MDIPEANPLTVPGFPQSSVFLPLVPASLRMSLFEQPDPASQTVDGPALMQRLPALPSGRSGSCRAVMTGVFIRRLPPKSLTGPRAVLVQSQPLPPDPDSPETLSPLASPTDHPGTAGVTSREVARRDLN